MKVWTFEQISNVLKVAGERKCQEAQACLEGMHIIFLMHVKFGLLLNPKIQCIFCGLGFAFKFFKPV